MVRDVEGHVAFNQRAVGTVQNHSALKAVVNRVVFDVVAISQIARQMPVEGVAAFDTALPHFGKLNSAYLCLGTRHDHDVAAKVNGIRISVSTNHNVAR